MCLKNALVTGVEARWKAKTFDNTHIEGTARIKVTE